MRGEITGIPVKKCSNLSKYWFVVQNLMMMEQFHQLPVYFILVLDSEESGYSRVAPPTPPRRMSFGKCLDTHLCSEVGFFLE